MDLLWDSAVLCSRYRTLPYVAGSPGHTAGARRPYRGPAARTGGPVTVWMSLGPHRRFLLLSLRWDAAVLDRQATY